MTASEAAPTPWEIWHARFNFDDHGCKFHPVLVLARTQDGLLGSMRPIRARMAGDLTAHHRRTTPNQASDMRLGQTRFQPCHDRRTILNTKHPTTPHNQPPISIIATRKLLTPYDATVLLINIVFQKWINQSHPL